MESFVDLLPTEELHSKKISRSICDVWAQSIAACFRVRQGLRKGHWSQLRFRGDEMLRPPASNEIAWLAVVLVRLSMWINRALGLDRAPDEDAHPDNIFQARPAAAGCCSVCCCSFCDAS